MYRIGVDVGGTFTDFSVLDEKTMDVHSFKVLSTPEDPSEAIQQGISALLDAHGIAPSQVSHLAHGTTVGTNMVIEAKGSPTGLLTTRGFRDILEIGRQTRPHLYDYSVTKPAPLVEREHRIEIDERVGPEGEVLAPLDTAGLEAAVDRLKAEGVASVAVCFLHSYCMPDHEKRAREVIEARFPEAYISLSCEVLPEFREYERLSTTVINAYLGPRMRAYLDRFVRRVGALGLDLEPLTVHSNGGLMSVQTVLNYPVRTCLSGPAAGVIGATEIAKTAGFANVITFDVGGTSTDVSLINESTPHFTSTRLVSGHPIKMPMIDIHVIGAGGGSIAWIDDAGALKVGPHSAGARPGPVAYGLGGSEPTITDANISLHRLNPVSLLQGRMKVDEQAARRVITERVAEPLGLSMEAAADGIIRIANANMARAIRSVSTERGYDINTFALFAYGGAGPLHAAELAGECGIPQVIVPQEPGTMCARGMLLTNISFDFVRTEIAEVGPQTWNRICDLFDEMRREGSAWLEQEKVAETKRSYRLLIEARYQGQNHEVKVDMAAVALDGLQEFLQRFEAAHSMEYGYAIPDRKVEIVNCRLQAVGEVPKAAMPPRELGGSLEDAILERRDVFYGGQWGWVPTHVYDRSRLPAEVAFPGPAVIEEMSSTTVVFPGQSAIADRIGNIVIHIKPRN